MTRTALRVDVTLTVHVVSCPGVWLPSNNEVYLSVNVFGNYRRTRLAEPVFPLIFQETFKFEKTFYTAIDPSEVSALLEIEPILFELVQLSDADLSGYRLLASHENNARDFLYPYPQLSPVYGCTDRWLLMDRAPSFPGIAPKMEFSTNAVVVETRVPRRRQSYATDAGATYATSDSGNRKTSVSRQSARTFVYPDEEDADKSFQQPTVSSISRSRSPSPSRLKVSDLSQDESGSERPNFLVRKVDKSLIHRTPGSPTERDGGSKKSGRRDSKDGKSTSGRPPRLCEKTRSSAAQRRKVTRSDRSAASSYYSSGNSSENDDSDVEYLGFTRDHSVSRRARTISLPPYQPRRPISPILLRRSLRDRYADYLSSSIRLRAESALRRSLSPLRRYSPSYAASSLRRSLSLGSWDSLEDLRRDFEVARVGPY